MINIEVRNEGEKMHKSVHLEGKLGEVMLEFFAAVDESINAIVRATDGKATARYVAELLQETVIASIFERDAREGGSVS